IDSATMMNKGLEVIEAYHLFDLKPSQIEVLVHPQSIIHSMVEFEDGVVMAQLGTADMRTAIQYAITHPNRTKNNFERLDFAKYNTLTFEKPDMEAFNCLALSYQALEAEWHYPAVLNAANEVAVDAFLNKKIKFLDISLLIEKALSAYNDTSCPLTIESVLEAEKWAKAYVEKEIG
ncbi:MAG: 1-deoxy-D-xylulose-5-phosphate reductoisomerase, partial [Defluviitaleaceae bacterium]|nr:1-deoxy-D-xylulose-5-phosphate reductoisomerase [Defluviitaleaceae bacterium]